MPTRIARSRRGARCFVGWGIGETSNTMGSACVIASKWEEASRDHEYHCPDRSEVRVAIGPFYHNQGRSWLPGDHDVLWANVVRTVIGPRGLVRTSYDFEMRQVEDRWRVARVERLEEQG